MVDVAAMMISLDLDLGAGATARLSVSNGISKYTSTEEAIQMRIVYKLILFNL